MNPTAMLRAYRPGSYDEHCRRELLLADPFSFAEEFDGVLFHLGRWPYEHVAERFDATATRLVDRFVRDGVEPDGSELDAVFEQAGWDQDEFHQEVERRLLAKLA